MADATSPDPSSRTVDTAFYEYPHRDCGGIHIMTKRIYSANGFNSEQFDAFEGFTLRVYIMASDPNAQYEMKIHHIPTDTVPSKDFASIKLEDGKPRVIATTTTNGDPPITSTKMDDKGMNVMEMFTFALRARKNAKNQEAFECLVFNDIIDVIAMPWKGLQFSENLKDCGRVSLHIYHDCGGLFPEPLRMVPHIKAFCQLNMGEEAIYQGKMPTTKPVRVVAPGLVGDLPIEDFGSDPMLEVAVELRGDYYFFATNVPQWFMMQITGSTCGKVYPPLFSSNYEVNRLVITQIMTVPKKN